MRGFLGPALAGALLASSCAAAAAFPEREIRLVNPFPPTGPVEIAGSVASSKLLRVIQVYGAPSLTDALAWRASRALTSGLAQPVSVDRRARGRGIPAHRYVAEALPDGYTLLVSDTASLAIHPQRSGGVGFDPARDLVPVAMIAEMPTVLAVRGRSAVHTAGDLITAARGAPRHIDFGSAGDFTAAHLAVEALRRAAGIDLVHVGYNGGVAAVNAMLSNQIAQAFVPLPAALPHARSGAVRLVAVAAAERFESLPGLPTLKEAGVPGVEAVAWYGIFAPAGTPAAVVQRLNAELVAGFNAESGRRLLLSQGLRPARLGPAAFATALERERERLRPLIGALVARDRAG
jgi:tripartite-type tricarboxylate transporter receptor subunit TctC